MGVTKCDWELGKGKDHVQLIHGSMPRAQHRAPEVCVHHTSQRGRGVFVHQGTIVPAVPVLGWDYGILTVRA